MDDRSHSRRWMRKTPTARRKVSSSWRAPLKLGEHIFTGVVASEHLSFPPLTLKYCLGWHCLMLMSSSLVKRIEEEWQNTAQSSALWCHRLIRYKQHLHTCVCVCVCVSVCAVECIRWARSTCSRRPLDSTPARWPWRMELLKSWRWSSHSMFFVFIYTHWSYI